MSQLWLHHPRQPTRLLEKEQPLQPMTKSVNREVKRTFVYLAIVNWDIDLWSCTILDFHQIELVMGSFSLYCNTHKRQYLKI